MAITYLRPVESKSEIG